MYMEDGTCRYTLDECTIKELEDARFEIRKLKSLVSDTLQQEHRIIHYLEQLVENESLLHPQHSTINQLIIPHTEHSWATEEGTLHTFFLNNEDLPETTITHIPDTPLFTLDIKTRAHLFTTIFDEMDTIFNALIGEIRAQYTTEDDPKNEESIILYDFTTLNPQQTKTYLKLAQELVNLWGKKQLLSTLGP